MREGLAGKSATPIHSEVIRIIFKRLIVRVEKNILRSLTSQSSSSPVGNISSMALLNAKDTRAVEPFDA